MSAAQIGRTPDSDSDWYSIDLGDIDHRLVSNPANIALLQAENASLTARVNDLVAQISRLGIEIRNTQEQNIALMEARDEHTGQIQALREETEGHVRTTTDLTVENKTLREEVRLRDAMIPYLMQQKISPLEISEMLTSINRINKAFWGVSL